MRQPAESIPNMPERVGRYELLLPIASGGMATVFLARHRGAKGFERDVALKLTHAHLRENPDFAIDLVEEAKLAVRIKHPNVVTVIDVGDDPLGVFLVMDCIDGDSLSGLMRRAFTEGTPLPMRIGLAVLCDALAGLHAAHELRADDGEPLNLVHRDFSPQNILVGLDGMSRLTDFGVAKAATRLSQTSTGLIKGKLGYMAPEQARGHKLDRRCDVWAAGVIAWEIAAGRRLFKSDNDVNTLLKLVSETPPRVSSVREIAPGIDDAIALALVPDVDARCADAQTFLRALKDAGRAAGEFADHAEVGAFVEQLVGAKLAERRQRANEVRRLRERVDELSEISEQTVRTPSSSAILPRAGGDDSQILVATAVRASSPGRADELPATDTTSVGLAPERVKRGSRRPLLIAATLLLSGALGLGVSALVVERSPTARPDTTPVPSIVSPDIPRSAATIVPSGPSREAPSTAFGTLTVKANAEVLRFSVDGKSRELLPPRSELVLDVSGVKPGASLDLVLVSVDGRKVKTRARPGPEPLEISFGPRPTPQAPQKSPIPTSPYRR